MSNAVSILIPSFNHDRYIVECLDSAAAAGLETQLVVFDDGSTDSSRQLIRRWITQHPAVDMIYREQENAGLTRTLNRMLSVASGEFVTMVASDDRLRPWSLAGRMEFLNAHPGMQAVVGDFCLIDAAGRVIRERGLAGGDAHDRERFARDPAGQIVENFGLPGPVLLYRRAPIVKIGGYREGNRLEDWDLYLRLAARGWLGYVDEVVSDYREHGENTVRRPDLRAALARELRETALRHRDSFGGRLRMALFHEAATYAWREAQAEGRRPAAMSWWVVSRALKVLSLVLPRRPSDLREVNRSA